MSSLSDVSSYNVEKGATASPRAWCPDAPGQSTTSSCDLLCTITKVVWPCGCRWPFRYRADCHRGRNGWALHRGIRNILWLCRRLKLLMLNIQCRTYGPETLMAAFQALLIYRIIMLFPVPKNLPLAVSTFPFSPHSMDWASTSPKRAMFILQKQHIHDRLGARGFKQAVGGECWWQCTISRGCIINKFPTFPWTQLWYMTISWRIVPLVFAGP